MLQSLRHACWAVPRRDEAPIDQQEVSRLDRLGQAPTGQHQHRLQEPGDPAPDPADRGLGHPDHVSDDHLGHVLPQQDQTDHDLLIELDLVPGEVKTPALGHVPDPGHDLLDHISRKTCSRIVTHRLLLREIRTFSNTHSLTKQSMPHQGDALDIQITHMNNAQKNLTD